MNKKTFSIILFFGAIWGILEATLGYALQFFPPLLSGAIMFPIGATLLIISYDKLKDPWALLYIGMIAASIKAINFLMPGLMPIKTYNPMIAIMLQSFVMVGVAYVMKKESLKSSLIAIFLASLIWRTLFVINITINNALTGFNFPQLQSTQATTNFIFLYGGVAAIFLGLFYLGFIKFRHLLKAEWRPHVGLSFALFGCALSITFLIQFIG